MAEWSKAIDSRSIIFGCAGSNPAGTIIKYSYSKYNEFDLSSTALRFVGSNPACPIKGHYPSGQRKFFQPNEY